MNNSYHDSLLGKWGEELACKYLKAQGYTILARNFRHHRFSEIDIIASKDQEICFIEVKTRAGTGYGRPLEAVTANKQRKIYRCAEFYLQQNNLLKDIPPLSFDVIEIIIDGTRVSFFNHLRHCF